MQSAIFRDRIEIPCFGTRRFVVLTVLAVLDLLSARRARRGDRIGFS